MNTTPANKILLIWRKEWIEIRQQRALMLGMALPSLIFSVLPLVAAFAFAHLPVDRDMRELMPTLMKVNPALAGMTEQEGAQALLGQQMALLFLLLPTILPSIIASYSIVGEKTSRTLEPLLATPISTWELLTGKALTAMIPSMASTWIAAGIFMFGFWFAALSPAVYWAVVSSGWLITLFLSAPLLGLITVSATVAISSRVNDPRTAQQISALIIIPVMLLFFGQLTGILVLNALVALLGAASLAVVAFVVTWIAVRLFQREVILTRWT